MVMSTCYMCERVSTSKEHAPPRCIFPKSKDTLNNINLRKNLICVPSCEEHNTEKSKDDEYLLYILAASITSNNVGLMHFFSKVVRAAKRRPLLSQKLTNNAVSVKLHDMEKDELIDAFALSIDGKRIDSILEKCARALYFYTYKIKFSGDARVITAFSLHKSDMLFNEKVADAFMHADKFFDPIPAIGENPNVFNYKIASQDTSTIIRLEFYGATKAIVSLKTK